MNMELTILLCHWIIHSLHWQNWIILEICMRFVTSPNAFSSPYGIIGAACFFNERCHTVVLLKWFLRSELFNRHTVKAKLQPATYLLPGDHILIVCCWIAACLTCRRFQNLLDKNFWQSYGFYFIKLPMVIKHLA